jgi:uncharacterized protein YegL
MAMSIANPFGRGYAERIPLVLVLDTSASMGHPADAPRIAELNTALREWFTDAAADPALCGRLEVAIVTFNSDVRLLSLTDAPGHSDGPFALVESVTPPELGASGLTLMLPAMEAAVRLATERTRELTAASIPSRRPLVWLVTDGAPTGTDGKPVPEDEVAAAAARLHTAALPTADSPGCLCYAIGVGGADMATLSVLVPAGAVSLHDFGYRRILRVVSESASRQQAGPADDEYARTQQIADRARRLRAMQDEIG